MLKFLSIVSLPLCSGNEHALRGLSQTQTASSLPGLKMNNKTLRAGHDWWVFTIAIESAPNLCLDVSEDGTLQAWECNGHESQLWFFDDGAYQIQWAGDSSQCIDGGDLSAGNQLYLWECNGMEQQTWSYDGTIYTMTDYPMCMDLYGGGTEGGTPVVAWDCLGLWSQTWSLSAGITIRTSADYELCLDLAGGSTDNGTPLMLWECNGLWEQKWIFDDWQIKLAADMSKCVDAGGLEAGNLLMLWDCNGAEQQFFGYDGSIYMSSTSADASLCVDLPGGSLDWGTQLEVYDCNQCWNQYFDVIGPVDGMLLHQSKAKQVTNSHSSRRLQGCPGDDVPSPTPVPPPAPFLPTPSMDEMYHYWHISAASWCPQNEIEHWSCGFHCNAVNSLSDIHFTHDGIYHEHQGLVAYDSWTHNILVSFRGATNWMNWVANIDYFKKRIPEFADSYPDVKLHRGFWNSWLRMKKSVLSAIDAVHSQHPDVTSIRLTGHSLGGVMTTNAAMDLKLNYGWDTSVVNFGSPRAGDMNYHNALAAEVPHVRITHANDVVPHLPPDWVGFHHASYEIYFPHAPGLDFKVCDGSGEDGSCADSRPFADSMDDHMSYMDQGYHCSWGAVV